MERSSDYGSTSRSQNDDDDDDDDDNDDDDDDEGWIDELVVPTRGQGYLQLLPTSAGVNLTNRKPRLRKRRRVWSTGALFWSRLI